MSITVSEVSFHYPNQTALFRHLRFSVEKQEKTAVIGDNGAGKSTLLHLIAGLLKPAEGSIFASSPPYYVPQHTGASHQTVAEMMRVDDKLSALDAIVKGSLSQADYNRLGDDWEIEARCRAALDYWQLPSMELHLPADRLSGGEKTKVLLAGLSVHEPEIVLLDEPTNHLDEPARKLLYRYIRQSRATIVVVSHDRMLLDQLSVTYELSKLGMKRYGGNYSFYREQKETEVHALMETIHAEEKTLRLARKKAQEMKQRQEKRLEKGQKEQSEVPRIFKKTLSNSSENTASRLNDKHAEIVSRSQSRLSDLKQQQAALRDLKADFNSSILPSGKLLIEAQQINFAYPDGILLWEKPLDFKLYSNDRVRIQGDNGAGKTTFIRLLTGLLNPSVGQIRKQDFNWIYLDQHYSQVDVNETVVQLAESYNSRHLPEHEVKLRLNRFLFPAETWDQSCRTLSGGEKMRLYLCCLMIGDQTPALIILDEPTNNLDIAGLQVLIRTIRNYEGCLLVVSHDDSFVREIGVTNLISLHSQSCSALR
jgi:ATPase subunit of ABC transporter with duplicated ATPase domains